MIGIYSRVEPTAALLAALILANGAFGPKAADTCCQPGAVQLSATQTKARLRHTAPISSPLLSHSMRIGNAVLVFEIGSDPDGNISCIRVKSGHPILIAAAIESIKNWKLRPTTRGRQRRPVCGTLVVTVSLTRRGIRTRVLAAEPLRR